MDMQRKLGILGFDPNHNQISSSLDDLAKAAATAKLARIIAEARYRVLSGMDPNTIEGTIELTPGTAPGGVERSARAACDWQGRLCAAGTTLGPNHPQSKALRAQMEELEKEINAEQNRLLVPGKTELRHRARK